MIFREINQDGFETLIHCQDHKTGLKAIIAIHSTVLGPSLGGCRMWPYATEQEGITDALRLARGMTYKSSISGLNLGGGKAIIFGSAHLKSDALFHSFGQFVEKLQGQYITAKDIGINAQDLKTIKKTTKHIVGIDGEPGSSGDPSRCTAWGVYHGMQACAQEAYGDSSLKGMRIALQGLGSVSLYLIKHLQDAGAILIGCDIDQQVVRKAQSIVPNLQVIHPDEIYDVECDIFSPCALGAILNKETLPRIKAKIIAGGANNQLATEQDGKTLMELGKVYAPDYVISSGGVINVYYEKGDRYNEALAFKHVEKIGPTMQHILRRAKEENQPTSFIADRMAEERIEKALKVKQSSVSQSIPQRGLHADWLGEEEFSAQHEVQF